MRGQAFVVFQSIKSAVRAKSDLDQYIFFDNKMVSFSFHLNLLKIGHRICQKEI